MQLTDLQIKEILSSTKKYQRTRTNYKYIFSLPVDKMAKLLTQKNSGVYLSYVFSKYQFSKKQLKEIFLKNSDFKRISHVLGGTQTVRENALNGMLRSQNAADGRFINFILKKLLEEDENFFFKTARYIFETRKKLFEEKQKGISSKIKLYFELKR